MSKIHKLAKRQDEMWELCHEALRIMKEGTIDAMERYIPKLNEDVVQQARQGRE